MENWGGITDWRDLEVIDADGAFVFPAWCDSHTHLVFADWREQEFEDRIHGLTYEEIAARGGGILNSADKLRNATENELYESTRQRLNEIARLGTGAVEIKSGYGLTLESELKMLRVITRLQADSDLLIKRTFLGAHAYPREFQHDHEGYIKLLINEMLPAIASEKLADYIDVFCEKNYFDVDISRRIIEAGAKYGLRAKIHVNQFNSMGGVEMAVQQNARSVDHLEEMSEADVAALANAETMATLLPSCSFFIKIPYAPTRRLIDSGAAVALATDYNPGSTPSGNIPLVISLACIQMGMTPQEAITAATLNGAWAMDSASEVGSITPGKRANLIITKPMRSPAFLPYAFGSDHIDKVILNGKVVR